MVGLVWMNEWKVRFFYLDDLKKRDWIGILRKKYLLPLEHYEDTS